MRSVNIAMLKAQLSQFLRFVKSGEEILVLEREQIIAKVVPCNQIESQVNIIDASANFSDFFVDLVPVRPKVKTNVLSVLLEERDKR